MTSWPAEPLLAAASSLVLALVLTPLWIRMAPRLRAVDRPRGRHQHRRPTPTAGGMAIFVSVWLPALALMDGRPPDALLGVLLASVLLVALNLRDDIEGLPPAVRLLVQLLLAAVVYVWGVRISGISNFGGLFGAEPWVDLGWMAAPVTVIWIVLVTNALNWLDGLDGLSAGVAAISSLTLAVMAAGTSNLHIGVTAAAVAGACIGFLRYNFAPAQVFMGDTGAMFLGFTLACLAVLGPYKIPTAAAVFVPILVLGVPLLDSVTAIVRRIVRGKNPLVGDRTHIHYRLVDRGLSTKQSVLVIYGMALALCAVALWLWFQ